MKHKPLTESDTFTQCPACKGRGTRGCVLGTLTCGRCNGTGRIDLTQPQDDVSVLMRMAKAVTNKRKA